MSQMSHQHSAKSLEETAAEWVARLDAGELTPQEQAALDSWLESDSRCVGAFARARAIFLSPGVQAVRGRPSLPALSARAARYGLLATAATVAAVVAGIAFLGRGPQVDKHVYSSELGEIRQIPLADGTRVTLNTNTALRVEYSTDARLVTLERGEAYF